MNHLFSVAVKLFVAVALLAAGTACSSSLRPVDLTVEYMSEPTSIDVANPRLSWINSPANDRVKGEKQTAWQVRVATSEHKLTNPDLWDSGKRISDDSYRVVYEGSPLETGMDCWWQVRVWDSKDKASRWSTPGHWTMGLMDESEWKAEWIGAPWHDEKPDGGPGRWDLDDKPAPMFRKSFELERKPVSAKAFVTGLGYFELYANGERIGDDCLAPNFTNYTERPGVMDSFICVGGDDFTGYKVMYLVYDLSDVLKEGDNAVGLLVGNGWYNTHGTGWPRAYGSPRMICQILLTYSDGSTELITSDTSWKVRKSAIVKNDEYRGEVFDANLEEKDWCDASYDDSGWESAVERIAPVGKMAAHAAPLDKVTEVLEPLSVEKIDEGFEVDFGKEISGWIRFRDVKGNKGDTLRVHYIIDQRVGDQLYIFSDEPCVDYAPKFAWYVFRKAVITGVDELSAENLRAEMVNTEVETIAQFESSNELFEKINEMWRLTQLDNMHGGVASDCPHREKSAYTGDGQVVCHTVMANFDAAAFYQKWIRDIKDAQNKKTGYVPQGAPWQPGCGGGVAWGAAMNIMPWEFYRYYGDKDFLAENYEAMKAQVRYMTTCITEDGTMLQQLTQGNPPKINYWANLGDWCAPGDLPSNELVHTFYLWLCSDITARAAQALETGEAGEFRTIAENARNAFHKKFYDPETCSYGLCGSNVFALYMGVPEEVKSKVVESLRKELEANGSRLNTGIFATRYLLEVLSDNGLNDLAYEIMATDKFPSFGDWLAQGSTTMWETWNGKMSRNHPMFGGCLTWFSETLAGINIDENAPGYKHIIIRPVLASKLESVTWSAKTPYGIVRSAVKHKDGKGTLDVTVPVGSTATVYIPGSDEGVEIRQGSHSFSFAR